MPTYKIVFNPDWPNAENLIYYPDEYAKYSEAYAVLKERVDYRYKGQIQYAEVSPGRWQPDFLGSGGINSLILGRIDTIYSLPEQTRKEIAQLTQEISVLEGLLKDKQERLDKLKAEQR